MRPLRSSLWLAVLVALSLTPVSAADKRADAEKLPVTRIRDLHYGDVLFYFYQEDDFEAITRLNAYEQWHLLGNHEAESQLLLGGLYLSLGLHNEAGQRFETLLTQDIPQGVRNRAWFYLGKVWYARGYLDRAEHALRQVQGQLAPALEAERQHLFANVLMRQGHFDEAEKLLRTWKGPADWTAYARFNLGVALVRENRLPEADPFLVQVGTLESEREEMLALKDRANLALGFAYLQAQQPEKARVALERVRLNGPYSTKALLGTGWADAALGDYQKALAPWMELRDRNLLDAAVQESYLAVPYAFGKLNANAQSAEFYEGAVTAFDSESTRIDDAVNRIRNGNMLSTMLESEKDAHYGWFWQLKTLPDAPESRYLYTVLAGHDFQEGLKNYRDLSFMGHTLDRWGDSMTAFEEMVDTRKRAYAERLPRADALLGAGAIENLQRTRDDLQGRLNAIESSQDVAALGSAEERDQWAQIQKMETALAGSAPGEEADALRDRLRLVKGVLYFRLNESFKARMWQQRRTIKDLDGALREAQSRWVRVEKARKSVPNDTGEFASRIDVLRKRIDALQLRLAASSKRQNAYLSELAVASLETQKDRLATYQVQARYALASMYDRAANGQPSRPSQPSTPVQQSTEPPPIAPRPPEQKP